MGGNMVVSYNGYYMTLIYINGFMMFYGGIIYIIT